MDAATGIARDDGVNGNLKWTSRYGSVVATAFDMMSVDGMNEAGLAGHVLWLVESDYGEPDASRTQLSRAARYSISSIIFPRSRSRLNG